MRHVVLAVLGLLIATGCGQVRVAEIEPHRVKIINGKTGDTTSYDEFLSDVAGVDVVYVAESHTNAAHHAVQLTLLRALAERRKDLGLGMEMFQAPDQPALDLYLSGEIGEIALLQRTEWKKRWGFNWDLYAPMVRFARERKIPLIALNAPSELTRAVGRKGLDGLSEEEKGQLPEMDMNSEAHKALVKEMLEGHPGSEDMFPRMYAAQVVWDETMATNTASYVANNGAEKRPMIVLAGIGHVAGGLGIPARVERRTSATGRTVIPTNRENAKEYLKRNSADWLWVVKK